ncbi:aminodeoxychorismate lyase [Lederbergia galactosidilytica]|uniref:4-amino-4-deoxychorismate lyase n=1 Tax=Lederbergia galactosidilytica TaxID=217031 RepID=A0A177ZQM8_9BACI|nr:aminodeoxychorismate lyase [Lederbergia galactosidilytica]OAK70044.1 4-amino-4-deoxychorismate lyase [Lederbergia galactosidilytica]
MYMYINGEYIRQEEARISPFDHGYLYGLGIFETLRTYNSHPFLLEQHLERLNYGLRQLQIARQFEYHEVEEWIGELSKLNDLPNSYIRFNVSAGSGQIGIQTTTYESPTTIIFQKQLPALKPLGEKEISFLKIFRNTPEMETRLKSHHFMNNVMAKREVGANPNKEGIFLTEKGFLAEGVTSNLFWIRNKTLYTPALETGILKGITREFILDLAAELGLGVEEGFYQKEDLLRAEEVFLTNSIQEIIPVKNGGKQSFAGKNGIYTQRFYQLYRQAVDESTK